jgi:hypothetical protein
MPSKSLILRLFGRVLRWLLPCALFAGCQRAAPPPAPARPAVADLHFPVAVIFGKATVVTFKDAEDLGSMWMGNFLSVDGPPPLIDSSFAIYRLSKLASTHSGLWMMVHPTGVTPVTFELEHAPESGIEPARALLLAYLDQRTSLSDLEQKRKKLASKKTLPEMLAIVQESLQ